MRRFHGAARVSNILSAANSDRRPRLDRWPALLREVLSRHAAAPFEWGVSDCAILFAEAVRVVTGYDPIFDGREYASAQGALRNVRAAGFRCMTELVAARFHEIPPAHARRGDLGYTAESLADDGGPLVCPAVINGAIAHSKTLAGHVIVPRGLIVRAFAV